MFDPSLRHTEQNVESEKDYTNITEIQASPSLSVCPILSTYKLTFPKRNQKLYQTKITFNGICMAKIAAQLLYGPVLVYILCFSYIIYLSLKYFI